MKIARRRWHVVERLGRVAAHLDPDAERHRVARRSVYAAVRRARMPLRDNRDPLRHHSIAMLPDPAPTSHSSSPGRGASAASVTARIDCLVICPSWANASSGSTDEPAVVGQVAHRDHVEVVDVVGRVAPPTRARWRSRRRSAGPPSCSSTVSLGVAATGVGEQPRQRRRDWCRRATARRPARRGAPRCAVPR